MIFACQKGETGDIGPAGDKGPKGETGSAGDVGLSNSSGMLVSSWVEIKPENWDTLNNFTLTKYFTLAGILTREIADKGNVYIYMQAGSNSVNPLPFVFNNGNSLNGVLHNNGTTQGLYIDYRFVRGVIIKPTQNYKFRIVVLPAGARVASGIDWSDYESVKAHLNLKD